MQDTKATEVTKTVETTPEKVATKILATKQLAYEVPNPGSNIKEAKKEITCTKEKPKSKRQEEKGVALVLMTFPTAPGDANWFHLASRPGKGAHVSGFLLRRARDAKMEAVRDLRVLPCN